MSAGLLELSGFHGICYGIAAIGLSIPLRFLGTADLTALGSFSIGGIMTIKAAEYLGTVGGIVVAIVFGAVLGSTTGWVSLKAKIPLMLCGIITFIGSISIALILAPNGSVSLAQDITKPFNSTANFTDIGKVGILAAVFMLLGALFAKSRFGVMAFALTGSSRFVNYRHRSRRGTEISLLAISNALVACAGGLIALRSTEAYTSGSTTEILTYSLGAIYAGHACVKITIRLFLKEGYVDSSPISSETNPDHEESRGMKLLPNLRICLSEQRDDSNRIGLYFFSYILAAWALNALGVSIQGKEFEAFISIGPHFEHLTIAIVMVLCLYFSNTKAS
jgi:ABC-type uncharacterized transport system permease subunit